MEYLEMCTRKNMLSVATGAGAVYLLYKTIRAGLNCPRFNLEPVSIARLTIEHGNFAVKDSGELRRLLISLSQKQDDYSKSMILHSITRCVYLLESEASACTHEDIKQVASGLDDKDKGIKIQTLNALKAFAGIRKFRIKIQEFVPKILELVTTIWDTELHIAGLRLLNGLPLPDHTHPLLRRVIPSFMEILQTGSTLVQVQVLKLLSILAQKEDLLYDIMNCQVHADFLNLFHSSLPGNLLYEVLVFVEKLSEGRLTPQYQSVLWEYNELSLHEVLFGEDSRLADRLLSLIIHPEEEVQIQACKVILSIQLCKEEEAKLSKHRIDCSYFDDDANP
ncbi:armadillo repeat-containing protein 12 [Emydura macquarii macquarii]|uniref:armadillo repeat-containing protein 12 n=1 Tax=Emydura macquarii macquarii TaxID=1129001 RepID=UPI00352AE04A